MHKSSDRVSRGRSRTKPGKPCACRALCRLDVAKASRLLEAAVFPGKSRQLSTGCAQHFNSLPTGFRAFSTACSQGLARGIPVPPGPPNGASTGRISGPRPATLRKAACRLAPRILLARTIHRLRTAFAQLVHRNSRLFHSFSTGSKRARLVHARIAVIRHPASAFRKPARHRGQSLRGLAS